MSRGQINFGILEKKQRKKERRKRGRGRGDIYRGEKGTLILNLFRGNRWSFFFCYQDDSFPILTEKVKEKKRREKKKTEGRITQICFRGNHF